MIDNYEGVFLFFIIFNSKDKSLTMEKIICDIQKSHFYCSSGCGHACSSGFSRDVTFQWQMHAFALKVTLNGVIPYLGLEMPTGRESKWGTSMFLTSCRVSNWPGIGHWEAKQANGDITLLLCTGYWELLLMYCWRLISNTIEEF